MFDVFQNTTPRPNPATGRDRRGINPLIYWILVTSVVTFGALSFLGWYLFWLALAFLLGATLGMVFGVHVLMREERPTP